MKLLISKHHVFSYAFTSLLASGFLLLGGSAFAGDATTSDAADAAKNVAPITTDTTSRLAIYGWVEGGITVNPATPNDHQNFGRLFDDRSNEPMLNQAVITLERVLAPKAGEFDWGFKLQAMEGTDARYTHSLGILDASTNGIVQSDLVEAYLNLHLPILTSGGVDMKVGKFVTLEGAETIDPRTNVFYSHSYIFNFGIPLNDTGVMTTWHATSWLDICNGITRGVNTSWDDNNSSLAYEGGIGLNGLCGGKLTISAATHIGAETPHDNHDMSYLNDITTTWKITDKFTSITDLNYIENTAADARGYGVAQYLTYQVNDWLTAGIRAEFWRDEEGFFVAQYASNNDFVHAEQGDLTAPDPRTVGGGATNYGAITIGATIKPHAPKPLTGILLRPEIRYDYALNGTHPFNDSSDRGMLTIGFDAIVEF